MKTLLEVCKNTIAVIFFRYLRVIFYLQLILMYNTLGLYPVWEITVPVSVSLNYFSYDILLLLKI